MNESHGAPLQVDRLLVMNPISTTYHCPESCSCYGMKRGQVGLPAHFMLSISPMPSVGDSSLMNRTISRKNPDPPGHLHSHILNRIIERIEANPLEQFDLADSYTRFIHAFRAQTGLSPYRYIMRLRLSRAKRLMRNRSLTLLEVALESGFASHAHLPHAFRQHFGCAPSRFRTSPIKSSPPV